MTPEDGRTGRPGELTERDDRVGAASDFIRGKWLGSLVLRTRHDGQLTAEPTVRPSSA